MATRMLHAHVWRAHKLALVPGQPSCLYSCGEDGVVVHYGKRCHVPLFAQCAQPSAATEPLLCASADVRAPDAVQSMRLLHCRKGVSRQVLLRARQSLAVQPKQCLAFAWSPCRPGGDRPQSTRVCVCVCVCSHC